jgi:hypothetical protein
MVEQTDEAELAEAATKPISTEKPLPASLKLMGPLSELIKLANSGVDESVLMAYVANSARPFNLDVEEIIYLNDIGVSGSVVTAMLQRDEALKGLIGSAVPAQAVPAPSAPATEPALAPGSPALYAPQPAPTPAPTEMATEGPPPGDTAAVDYSPPPVADTGYSTFYDSLAPYGTWVEVAGYGPCWQPTVVVANPAWRPYCDSGRWVNTDCGWYWMSGYSWGWAPFHYGRWFQHHRLGWCWAPDRVWGPSWVCWRYGESHCGWAPLPPGSRYRPGIGLTFHGRPVGTTFGFGLGVNSFAFVDVSHFRNPHLNRYALPPQQAAQVYNRTVGSTRIVDNRHGVINHGIPVSRVAAATGTEIHQVAIRDANSTARQGTHGEQFEGHGRSLSVVRPQFPTPGGTQSASGGRSRPIGSDPAPRSATPLILHGPNRSAQATTSPQGTFARPTVSQRPPSVASPAWSPHAPSAAAGSAPRAIAPSVRSEPQRQYTAPSYPASALVQRVAPAPTPAPQPTHSYSPPAVSSAPRAPAVESRPSYSAPSAPVPSAPASHGQSSSDKRGR